MKFGKRLKQQIEQSLGDWRDKYLSYKELKKLVNLMQSKSEAVDAEFMSLLEREIDKFNAFFIEQEEDFVIRHKVIFLVIYPFFFKLLKLLSYLSV